MRERLHMKIRYESQKNLNFSDFCLEASMIFQLGAIFLMGHFS